MDKNEKIMNTLREYKKELEEKGYNVIYIGLYGSQNYNLDDEQSDVDARAIVIPKLREIIERKSISTDYTFDTGIVDVKDLLTYHGIVKKGNFSFIEPFQTEWYIGDETLRTLFSKFKVNPQALLGAMHQKHKNMLKKDSNGEIIEYSAKDYHHLVRLNDILDLMFSANHFNTSHMFYSFAGKEKMMQLKRENININCEGGMMLLAKRMGEANFIVNEAIKKVYAKEHNIEQPDFEEWIVDRIISEVKEECLWMKEEK